MTAQKHFHKLKIKKTETMLTVIGVPDVPGTAAGLFRALAERGISITMIVQNAPDAGFASITFTVETQDAQKAQDVIRAKTEALGAEGLMRDDNIARLSVWGSGLEETAGIAGEFFSILAENGVNVLAINTTSDVISCIIVDAATDKAVAVLEKRFGVPAERIG